MTRIWDYFTISLFATACFASLMLAAAEGGWLLPSALTLPIAITAYVFVERRGVGLSTPAANSLGITAVGLALAELFVRDIEGRILFGAHLLVYLSWILLWQAKGSHQRWGLIALSVLQIAVGAVLTNAGGFGMAMIGFVILAIWTLVLLQLVDAENRLASGPASAVPMIEGPMQLLSSGRVSSSGPAALGRWSPREAFTVACVTVLGAIGVGSMFFLLIPRVEVGRHSFDETNSPLARQRTTGFTERVRLGAFGEILESSVPVFEVRLYDRDEPVEVEAYSAALGLDEPLFRGLTLHDYKNGEWAADGEDHAAALPAWPFADQIRQEYRLKSHSFDVLFAIAPVYAGHVRGSDGPIRRRHETETLFRPPARRRSGELTYEVFSPRTAEMVDRLRDVTSQRWPSFRHDSHDEYLELPDGVNQLRSLAAEVARPTSDGEPASPELRAERLLAYLRDSGVFRYSLSGELIDPNVDPIEDFLFNRRAGHCEYFASALALMLRAEGIPSRVVSGFKGGEPNRFNGAFEVQQRHAHAWVEAFLDDRWVTFDPSPASERSQTVAENAPSVPLWSDLRSAASNFWYQYVLQMDLAKQQRTLAPLREMATRSAESVQDRWWPAIRRQLYALATDPSRWFSWQGGVATFVGLSLITILWRIGRRLNMRFARLRAAREAQLRRGRRIEFYERFRRLCERRGWLAESGQTPREFAADVAAALAEQTNSRRLLDLPSELTEDFYEVRFGSRELSDEKLQDLGGRLQELEAALGTKTPSGRPGEIPVHDFSSVALLTRTPR